MARSSRSSTATTSRLIVRQQRVPHRQRTADGFNHNKRAYLTCFGCVHVKHATSAIGVFSLLGVCFSLSYRVKSSQEAGAPANLKMAALPLVAAIISTLYLFIGILRQKAKLLMPFVVIQVCSVFALAIMLVVMLICVACDTRYVIEGFIGQVDDDRQYTLSVWMLIAALVIQLAIQMWTTRTVCVTYRYFNELHAYRVRLSHYV